MIPVDWIARADAVTDAELAEFRRRICVEPAHIGICAIGTCSRCGGGTASGSMQICDRCARELGVCPYDQRMTGWGSVSAPEGEAIAVQWLALWMRGYAAERIAARHALESIPLPGLSAVVAELERQPGSPTRSPATAEFIVGFRRGVPEGLAAGMPFLNGTVVSIEHALAFAVVRTPDAAAFEDEATGRPEVRYVELNSGGGKPPWE